VSATNSTWNNTSNWSTSSGGVGGASIPGPSDQVIFDANGLGDATLSANLSLSGLIIHVGYTGAIELSGFTLNISGTSQVSFVGGTLNNGALNIQSSSIVLFNGTIFNTSVSSVSARLLLNGSTFNRAVSLEKTGSINDFCAGGNTFNDTTIITMSSAGGALHMNDGAPGATGVDTFRTEVTFNNTGTGLLSIAEKRDGNFFGGNIRINSTGGIMAFGFRSGSSTLAVGKTIQVGSGGFSGGFLLLGGMNMLDPNPWNIAFTGTAGLHFNTGSVFHGEVNSITPGLCLNGATYLQKATLEKTGPGLDFCTGGSVFNDTTVITMSSIGGAIHMSDGAPGATGVDTFRTDVTFNNTGTGLLSITEKRDGNFFGGNIKISSTGGIIAFGMLGGSATLAVGNTIEVDTGGFSGVALLLGGMKMLDPNPWNIAFTGAARLHFNAGSVFHGEVNSTTPGLCLNGATFLKKANLEKTGPTVDFCTGGSVFNDTTVITMSSIGGALHMSDGAPGATGVDTFRTAVTFNNFGTGLLSIAEKRDGNLFGGSVLVNGTGGRIDFGRAGGSALISGDITANRTGSGQIQFKGILLNGPTAQAINGTASLPPTFISLEIDNPLGVTLNTAIDISGRLQLTTGNLFSDIVNIVTFRDNAVVSGGSPISFVAGPVRKIGNDGFIFPTGNGSSYQPIGISPPTSVQDEFIGQYFDTVQTSGSSLDTGLGSISICEYWQLDHTVGTSSVEVTLGWNANSCDAPQVSDTRVAHWEGAKWTNLGNGGTTGDPNNGTVKSAGPVSDFGVFVLGSATPSTRSVDDIDLGVAAGFALLAGNAIQATNPILAIGNVGAVGTITDSVFASDSLFLPNDLVVQQAIGDLGNAINVIKVIPGTSVSGSLGGQSLSEGVYDISANAFLSGNLTLTGDSASIYVFKIDDTLAVDSGAILNTGNVKPENIYWVTLNSHVSIGSNTNFSGIVLTQGNIVSSGLNKGSLALLTSQSSITLLNKRPLDPVYLFSPIQMSMHGPPNSISVTVANVDVCGNTTTFSVNAFISDITCGLDIIIDLPNGIEYVSGSVDNGGVYALTDNTVQPSVPTFFIENTVFSPSQCTLGPLGPDTTVTVTYDVRAVCGAIANDSALVSTSVVYTSDTLIETLDVTTSIRILTPFLTVPQTNGLVPELLEGNVGDTLCRDIVIENSGNVTLTSGFTVIETFGPSIEIVSLSIDSIPLVLDTVGSQLTIFIPDSLLTDSVLLPQDFVTIRECVIITSCTSDSNSVALGTSSFNYFWECNSAVCQEDSVTANVKVPSANIVDMKFPATILNPDVCYGPDNSTRMKLVIRNNGLAPALNSSIELKDGVSSAIIDQNFGFVDVFGDTVVPAPLTAFSYNTVPGFCKDSVLDFARFYLGDIGPLDSVILLFNVTTCCPTDTICDLGATSRFRLDFQYQDQCQADTDTVYIQKVPIFNEVSSSDLKWESGPAQLLSDLSCAQVDTGEYIFENRAALNRWQGDSTEAIRVVFTLDPGLCYDNLNGNTLTFVSGAVIWQPDSIVADIDSNQCGGTVSAWFPLPMPQDFDWPTAKYKIRVFGMCPAPPNGNLTLEVFHLPTRNPSCTNPCALSLACDLTPISIQCCGCDRHGTENTSYEIQRISLGGPDNNDNGVQDPSGLPNPKVLDLAMVGDTFEVEAGAFVQPLSYPVMPAFSDTLFKFAYYTHNISDTMCNNALTHLDARVFVYDANTADTACSTCDSTYEFTIPASGISRSGNELIYDLSIEQILGYNVTPTSNHFGFGDSIFVFPKFLVSKNITTAERNCFTGPNFIYLGISDFPECDDPVGGKCEPDSLIGDSVEDCLGNRFSQCDSTIRFACTKQNGAFKLVRYDYTDNSLLSLGCPSRLSVTNRFNIGTLAKKNYFEREYRHFGITDTAIVPIPLGFVFDSVQIRQVRLNGTVSVIQTVVGVIPDLNIGDTLLYFSLSKYYASAQDTQWACASHCFTDSLYPGDEESSFSVDVYFHPTCSTLSDTIQLTPFIGFSPAFNADSGQVFAGTTGFSQGLLVYTAPSFEINGGILTVDGVTREVCWEGWEIKNTGGEASNFWMIDSSPSGNITITDISVVNGNQLIEDSGVFQGGIFPRYKASKEFIICAEYTCDTLTEDSVYIYFGWNCPDYPTSLADYPCQMDSFILKFRPKFSILQDSVVLSATTMDICDTMGVDVFVSSAGIGNLYDLMVETEILGGTFIDSSSATFGFPGGSLPQSIAVPALVNDRYTWDINSLDSFITAFGFPGSGFVKDADSSRFVLSFDLVGNCNLERVNTVTTNVYGFNNCGAIDTALKITSTFTINNYPSAIPKALTVSSTEFSTCDSIATITVEIVHNDSLNTTDANDLFNFMLPPCTEFVQSSFVDSIQGPTDTVPVIIGNTLTWNLLPDVFATADSLMVFQFDIQITGSTCGTSFSLQGNTTVPDSLFCKIDSSTNDSNFCQFNLPAAGDSTTASLSEPLVIDSTAVAPNTCNGSCNGSAIAFASGGRLPYTYIWPNGDNTAAADSLCADTIILVIRDAANCEVIATLIINEPELLSSIIISTTPTSCDSLAGTCDGAAVDSVIGGTPPYLYLWSNGETSSIANALCNGSEQVIVTDNNGCIDTTLVTISSPDPISISVTNISNVTCFGLCDGSTTVAVTGGTTPYTLLWDDPLAQTTLTANNLCAGNTTITITDSSGCMTSQGVTIVEPTQLSTTIINDTVSCNGGSDAAANLTVSGGIPPYAYLWSTGDTSEDISGLVAGTYTVNVTDSNGCAISEMVVVEEPASLNLILAATNLSCNGDNSGAANLTVTGGIPSYIYLWSNGESIEDLTNLGAGFYSVVVTDANGCFDSAGVNISEPALLTSVFTGTDATCNGSCDGVASVGLTGGTAPYTYQWVPSGGTNSIDSGLCAGFPLVIIFDNNQCFKSVTVPIGEPPLLEATLTSSVDLLCAGDASGAATVTPSGGNAPYQYLWSPQGGTDSTATGLTAGLYSVLVSDSKGCDTSVSVTIGEPGPISFTFVTVDATCSDDMNGAVTINASGGAPPYQYEIIGIGSQPTPTFTGLAPNGYAFTVADSLGCSSAGTFIIGPAILVVTLSGLDSASSCTANDGKATANVTGGTAPYTYVWSNGETTQTATSLPFGAVTVAVTDINGCTSTKNTSINSIFNLGVITSPACGGGTNGTATVILTGGVGPFLYQWDAAAGNQTTQTATGLAPGTYCVTVTDADTCTTSKCTTITDVITYNFQSGVVIASDTTWSNVNFSIDNGIVILSGAKLIISNSTIRFSDNGTLPTVPHGFGEKGIYVEPGAKLLISNSTLTSVPNCNVMWDGIGVMGKGLVQGSPFTDPFHGFVLLSNNSVIENAHTAIQSGCEGQCFRPAGGGVVKTVNSKLINNRRDVVLSNYDLKTKSSFASTEFLTTAPLLDTDTYNGEGTSIHVQFNNANGVKLTGCTFENTGSFSITGRGTAIRSFDAKFEVDASSFQRMYYGIDVSNVNAFNAVNIHNSTFTDTRQGVYLSNVYGAQLNSNVFDMPVSTNSQPYGIYLDGSTSYEVEENEFFTASSQTLTIGILANNSGSSGDELYNNAFHDLGIGIQTQGDGNLNSNQGLQIKCNDFVNDVNFFDILNITGDIGDPQGQCISGDVTSPAGNTFSHTCNSPEGDAFANTSTFFKYNHHNDTLRTPQCISSSEINVNNCFIVYTNKETACPSNFTIGGDPCGFGPGPCGPVIVKLKGKSAELRTAFDSLLDGGNTAALLATVATKSSGQVKNALIDASPYVSDTVLLAYLNKPTKGKNHVSPGHVKEVVVANSPLTGKVKLAVDNRNLPLGIKIQIDAAQIGVSSRDSLDGAIRFFERQVALAVNSLNRFFLHDTSVVDGKDSVISRLEKEPGNARKLQLTEAYISADRFSEARFLLDALDTIGSFTNFCKINNIIIDILEDSATFDTLLTDSLLKLTVENIAKDTLQHGYLQARAMLSIASGVRFREHIEELPQQQQLKIDNPSNAEDTVITHQAEIQVQEEKSQMQEQSQYFNIYPNPANNKLYIEYSFVSGVDKGSITFYEVTGKQLHKHSLKGETGKIEIQVENWDGGLYFYMVRNKTAVLRRGKLIVAPSQGR